MNKELRWAVFSASIVLAIGDFDYLFALFAWRITRWGEKQEWEIVQSFDCYGDVKIFAAKSGMRLKCEVAVWTGQCTQHTNIDQNFSDETVEIMAPFKVLQTNLRNELNERIGIW